MFVFQSISVLLKVQILMSVYTKRAQWLCLSEKCGNNQIYKTFQRIFVMNQTYFTYKSCNHINRAIEKLHV